VNGWLKSINYPFTGANDPGLDGGNGSSTSSYPPDSYGQLNEYFLGDFYSEDVVDAGYLDSDKLFYNKLTSEDKSELFDGNISAIQSANQKDTTAFERRDLINRGQNYDYDQIGRLTKSQNYDFGTRFSEAQPYISDEFSSSYTYDPNGNIQTLYRTGSNTVSSTSSDMDELSYNYKTNSNQLEYVDDAVLSNSFSGDIEDQSPGNFTYNEIGQLTQDKSEGIDSIKWTPDGKISNIYKSQGIYSEIEYYYDERGDRVAKYLRTSSTFGDYYEVYARDAGGKVLAVYSNFPNNNADNNTCICINFINEPYANVGQEGQICTSNYAISNGIPTLYDVDIFPFPNDTNSVHVDTLRIENGMLQVSGFGDLIFLGYETVPCTDENSNVFLTEWHIYGNESQGRIGIVKPNNIVYSEEINDYFSTTFNPSGTFHREINQKFYAIKDHLGSERVVISDVKEPSTQGSKFYTNNISVSNYYPFGSLISDISRSSEQYRYGYNGKENDNEIAGKNATTDFGARTYANRLARFLSTDPLKSKFPSQSSYIYAGNNPILFIDVDGKYESRASLMLQKAEESYLKTGNKEALQSLYQANFNGALIGTSIFGATGVNFGFKAILKNAAEEGLEYFVPIPLLPKTNLKKIENKLQKAANKAQRKVGATKDRFGGTKVHSEFNKGIDKMNKKGYPVHGEKSFKGRKQERYGKKGSVRPDVIVGDPKKPSAVFDLKTGNAKITKKQQQKLDDNMPLGTPKAKEIKPRK